MEGVYLYGFVGLCVFYALILLVGLFAARKGRSGMEGAVLADRKMGIFTGTFTMTATWVGSGFVSGTVEGVHDPKRGLLWSQAPFAYALSLVIGGAFFARKMRSRNDITMLDPLQHRYGPGMGALLFIPALFGEIFWSAAMLATLGSTVRVVLGLDELKSITASVCVTVLYTAVGGLTSVVYTDVLQLLCVFLGLWATIPFAITNDAVSSFTKNWDRWSGEWSARRSGLWVDSTLLLTLGSVPWQVFFQRILAMKTPARAQALSVASAVWSLFMAVPAVIIGAIATSTDWSQTSLNETWEYTSNSTVTVSPAKSLILPLVLRHLTPQWVSVLGLAAVSSAVMSSADSSFLATSSMFAHNVYKVLFRPLAYETEVLCVMRISIFVVGACAAAIALQLKSVYTLWYLSGDLVYVVLFPQLFCALHLPGTNTYGSFFGFIVGLGFRILGGEPSLNIPVLLEFPFYSPAEGQLFSFKTTAMLASLLSIIIVSFLLKLLFIKKILPSCLDFLGRFKTRKISRGSYVNELLDMTDETLNGKLKELKESDV